MPLNRGDPTEDEKELNICRKVDYLETSQAKCCSTRNNNNGSMRKSGRRKCLINLTKNSVILSCGIISLFTTCFFSIVNCLNQSNYLNHNQYSSGPTDQNQRQLQHNSNGASNSIAPTIDYSHNMRILKLPQSTPPGSLIYRLKGSDGDPNTKLSFGINGPVGIHQLLDVQAAPEAWNEADVYLRGSLDQSIYNLTVYVTDGNKTTQVDSTILVIPETGGEGGSGFEETEARLSPFLNTKYVFHVPENTKPNELIGSVSVLESQKSDLPVRFELRGKGSDKFSIRYVFGPKGQSRGELLLKQPLDHEKQNLFNLKILALNAWTNQRVDTRNVATLDVVITTVDVQDTPPIFKPLAGQSIKLFNTLKPDAILLRVEAEDGDFADQRPIQYALDANAPLANYFNIHRTSGEISLIKPVHEFILNANWNSLDWQQLVVFASEVPDASSYDHLWPPMFSKLEIPIYLIDLLNEAPEFLGGWQTVNELNEKVLHGFVGEISSNAEQKSSLQVSWYTNGTLLEPSKSELVKSLNNQPIILDLGTGTNGTFELSLDGPDKELFFVEPSFPIHKQTLFSIGVDVKNAQFRALFDHEQLNARRTFQFNIIARDLGQPIRKTGRIKCQIDLLDSNDNHPEFERDFYTFSIYENALAGAHVGQIRAHDMDSNQRIEYTALAGVEHDTFKLDQETGRISLRTQKLDRERKSQYLLLAEASDLIHKNYTKILIQVLDTNDNAPQFLQSHYEAILMPDGQFYNNQPLIVKAIDLDEPQTANSEIAYEIIAGNLNDQFSIDSVSGQIYPTIGSGSAGSYLSGPDQKHSSSANVLPQIPPILKEPIKPFKDPDLAGKILPTLSHKQQHEIEETTQSPASGGPFNFPRSLESHERNTKASFSSLYKTQQLALDSRATSKQQFTLPVISKTLSDSDPSDLPGLDLMLNLESSNLESYSQHQGQERRSLSNSMMNQMMRVPPITTLIVRAHDFGIPLRSSTIKVSIFNQAMLSRSVSVILNGTAESLEQRKELIERAFSSITGSRATIESIDSLSDSSSISVARLKLVVPLNSLVDLTDLGSLMSAIDYHPADNVGPTQRNSNHVTHYITQGDKIFPIHSESISPSKSSNITSSSIGAYFPDVHSFAIDNQILERRLLIYIIIVGVCILALLLVWLIYSCTRDEKNHSQAIRLIDDKRVAMNNETYRPLGEQTGAKINSNQQQQTTSKSLNNSNGSSIGNNLAKTIKTSANTGTNTNNNELSLAPNRLSEFDQQTRRATNFLKPDHFSMYNGQIWFEPGSLGPRPHSKLKSHSSINRAIVNESRRASSAPSANGSLDSTVLIHQSAFRNSAISRNTYKDGSGQFFPNTIGYMENLADLHNHNRGMTFDQNQFCEFAGRKTILGRRGNKISPMNGNAATANGHVNEAFEIDLESGAKIGSSAVRKSNQHEQRRVKSRTLSHSATSNCSSISSASAGSSLSDAVVLDSDQELLGFDSTGTPIIATHTRSSTANRSVATNKTMLLSKLNNQVTSESKPSVATTNLSAGSKSATNKGSKLLHQAKVSASEQEVNLSEPEGAAFANQAPTPNLVKSATPTQKPIQGDLMGELNAKLNRRKQEEEEEHRASANKAHGPSEGKVEVVRENSIPLAGAGLEGPDESANRLDENDSSVASSATTVVSGSKQDNDLVTASSLADMKNGELLEKQSIFAITYSGLATDKLPS